MSNIRVLVPDFIAAQLAVIIGFSAMFVYLYQVRIVSKRVSPAARPFLALIFSKSRNIFFAVVFIFEICHCSMLGDCYKVVGAKTQACTTCD